MLNEALLIRMICTGLVVVIVSWSVGAFGPLVGGAVAGLPMVLGPAFFFLAKQAAPEFVATAATYALIALCATQLFVFTYMVAARSLQPLGTLALSICSWTIVAFLCKQLPAKAWLGCVLFLAVTVFAIGRGRSLLQSGVRADNRVGWGMLLFRGALAGVLVAVITAFSGLLGAPSAGVLLAFPIGYTVIATTIHQKMGASHAINTLHAALSGGSSLAAFCLTLALLVTRMDPMLALGGATVAAVLTTVALVRYRGCHP